MPYIFAIILYAIFLLAPGIASPFDGIPLDTLAEGITFAGILPLLFFIRPPRTRVSRLHLLLIPIIIGKIIIGSAGLEEGLTGSYYVENSQTPAERSTEFIHMPYGGTRFDRDINFIQGGYANGARPLPVWFLNGAAGRGLPAAEKAILPVIIEWKGYLYVPAGAMAVVATSDGKTDIAVTMPKKESVIPITVRYAASSNPDRFIRLSWDDAKQTPVTDSLYPKPYAVREVHFNYFLKLGDTALKVLVLILLIALCIARPAPTPWHALLASAGIGSFLIITVRLLRAARHPYFAMLSGGNDPLTYETYARYLQFTGNWSMAAIEQGSYYYQPYYYFVALMHYLGGEGLFPLFLMQGSLIAGAGLCLAEVGRRIVGMPRTLRDAWPLATLPIALALIPPIANEAQMLFPSVFGIFFASLTAFFLMRGKDTVYGGYGSFVCAGIALGFGIMSRFNFLSWLPLILIWLICGRRGGKRTLFFALGLILVLGPVLIRNKVVSGYTQLFSRSNATINFIKSVPPEAASYTPKKVHPKIAIIHDTIFDGRATPVMAWIAENPTAYARQVILKAKNASPWLFLPAAFFMAASCVYLASLKSNRLHDYVLMGLFPITQAATILLLSDNSMRYYLPALAFAVLWSVLLATMATAALIRIVRTP